MTPRCLLDMDGVLVDFVGGACNAHRVENPYAKHPLGDAAGAWDIASLLGMTEKKFWQPLNNAGFWAWLDWMPDGREILETVERLFGQENVCLLTSPNLSPWCASGKVLWIERNMPAYKRRFLIGPRKEFCAFPGNVLVDDNDKNVHDFVSKGGSAVIVPRPWNASWHLAGDSVPHCVDHYARVMLSCLRGQTQ